MTILKKVSPLNTIRRMPTQFLLFVLIWFWGIAAAEDNTNATDSSTDAIILTGPFQQYQLPSFSLTLQVDKYDNSLITFQDRLEETLEDHLEVFFQHKLESILKVPTKVRFDLDSKLVWRELSSDASLSSLSSSSSSSSQTGDYQAQVHSLGKRYDVRGQYDTQMILNYHSNETVTKEMVVTRSLMTLLFIESFQGRNYWDLIHRILSSPTLKDTTDVAIVVLEDGFVPYSGGALPFDDDHWFGITHEKGSPQQSTMGPGMIVALAFVTFFCLAIIVIWTYLCYNVPVSFFMKNSEQHRDGTYKGNDGSSVTEDACTNDSIENGSDDEASWGGNSVGKDWMDIWAKQITSIPIREQFASPRRKKRGQPTRQSFLRPAHQYVSDLDCITELDNESCCNSTVVSAKTTTSTRTSNSKDMKDGSARPRPSPRRTPSISCIDEVDGC
ncbi:hypothetical protein IV203_028380 [Nitzschia inconspicua]|uniref:Uncharacterized protein n=1 Tax=Nitzschia inconspicua TaxID=303405 RepID=A0A9K3Q098_9STRA|nr:hypothetical protein IV203_028380 [Nitzschia inconspicua]